MSVTGLEAFDRTVHKTNAWLNELMQTLDCENKAQAYRALRATLHALRDRLTVEEVAQLGAQLPMLVRGFYYEQWDPTRNPLRERHREQFLARIEQELKDDPDIDPVEVARAVFALLEARVSAGEIEDVKQVLPAELRSLWPARTTA
jgi:uncharacterized protein (DUF2267 family)